MSQKLRYLQYGWKPVLQKLPIFRSNTFNLRYIFHFGHYINSLIKDTSYNSIKVIFDHFDILAKIQLISKIRNSTTEVIFSNDVTAILTYKINNNRATMSRDEEIQLASLNSLVFKIEQNSQLFLLNFQNLKTPQP